jgi:thermitase
MILAAASFAADFVEGELLVKFKPGTPVLEAAAHVRAGARVIDRIPQIDVVHVSLPRGLGVSEATRLYRSLPGVEYAEPNYIATTFFTVNDPHLGNQWALPKINAPLAWDVFRGNTAIKVAVLDTGAEASHPDLKGKIVQQYDFVANDGVAEDKNGHGTHTAGTVAAATNNGVGVAAIGFGTPLMIAKVLNNAGSGTHSAIANGIRWAADNGASVISMSLGGSSGSTTLESAVNYAWNKGVLVVAAAGNAGNTALQYPAAYANCMAVAATDRNDARASFSTYGSWIDCAAPGVSILSTYTRNRYAYSDGTSMACPHVAGLAALVWDSAHGTSNQNVRSRINSTGTPVSTGFGSFPTRRINAWAAVN